MTLDRLVAEIQARADRELSDARGKHAEATGRIASERDRKLTEMREQIERQTADEIRRERSRRIAGARMAARKVEYEARERALAGSLEGARKLLAGFLRSPEYPEVLRRMYAFAVSELGKDVRISGRAEDAPLLQKIAGKAFQKQPLPILGGLVAETPEGARRLSLSFDELLRLREGRIRQLLAS
jgi:V/A-type H+/Na+-transporting ATPase subunit E